MSRDKLDQAIERNIQEVLKDSGMIEPPNELMERAKFQAQARGLKTEFPEVKATKSNRSDPMPEMFAGPARPVTAHNIRQGIEELTYPNYGSKDTCPEWYGRWKIEPNTFCVINGVNSAIANIIKYIMRHDLKDGLKDLYKARDYLNMLIEHEYGRDKV